MMSMRMSEEELKQLLKNKSVRIHGTPSSTNKNNLSTVVQKPTKKILPGHKKTEFQSVAEQKYFECYIQPLELSGQLERYSMHETFTVLDGIEFQGKKLQSRKYSPDFMLYFKDGTVKAVEIKGKKIRQWQREYPIKRQLFIMRHCIPKNWIFEEVSSEELTG